MNKSSIFFILLSVSLLCFSCETVTEDTRFENFSKVFQKSFNLHFSEGKYALMDSTSIYQLTDNEIFKDAQFCNEQLGKLASFELTELSPENQKEWKNAFEGLKRQLEKIEQISSLREDEG